jgi:hypothetical protein
VALEHRLQLVVEFDEARAGGERFGSEFADEAGGHVLGRHADGLLGRSGKGTLGKGLDMRDAAAGLEMADDPFGAGGAQFGRRDIGQQVQRPLGGEVEAALEAGKDGGKQVVHAAQTLGLGIDQIASPAHQQPDLEIDLGGGFDWTQIGSHVDLVGDGAGVARIGLVLAADGALSRPG